jgi:hypothetical protein
MLNSKMYEWLKLLKNYMFQQAGPCPEDDYKRMFTECSQRIDNILAMDNLQEMTMLTTKEEYLLYMECVVPFGAIETPTSPITLPSTGGCSHAVPECIEAILSFVKGCASSLSGAEEERHYYEMVRTHLVQLITHVLPEAISTSFKDRQLSVKEGIQLFLNASQLRDFPESKYFKREVKDKYPLLIGDNLEWDLSCNDVQQWEPLKHCAWTTINQAVFTEMKWEATFLRINWLPEDSTQAAQMDYLKPVDNYLKLLAAILEHPGLDDNLCEKHNCFTSLLFELDNCIVGMFSNNVVENFNTHAVTAINSNIQDIQRFAEDIDGSWFRSTDTYGLISSALSNARKWVDMLMSIEPQLLPDRLSREDYYIFLKDAYELDADSRTVISVCEKFAHSDDCRAMSFLLSR